MQFTGPSLGSRDQLNSDSLSQHPILAMSISPDSSSILPAAPQLILHSSRLNLLRHRNGSHVGAPPQARAAVPRQPRRRAPDQGLPGRKALLQGRRRRLPGQGPIVLHREDCLQRQGHRGGHSGGPEAASQQTPSTRSSGSSSSISSPRRPRPWPMDSSLGGCWLPCCRRRRFGPRCCGLTATARSTTPTLRPLPRSSWRLSQPSSPASRGPFREVQELMDGKSMLEALSPQARPPGVPYPKDPPAQPWRQPGQAGRQPRRPPRQ